MTTTPQVSSRSRAVPRLFESRKRRGTGFPTEKARGTIAESSAGRQRGRSPRRPPVTPTAGNSNERPVPVVKHSHWKPWKKPEQEQSTRSKARPRRSVRRGGPREPVGAACRVRYRSEPPRRVRSPSRPPPPNGRARLLSNAAETTRTAPAAPLEVAPRSPPKLGFNAAAEATGAALPQKTNKQTTNQGKQT